MRAQAKNAFGVLMIMLLVSVALVSNVFAASVGEPLGISVESIMVNGAEVTGEEDIKTQFLRGEELDVVVVIEAGEAQENVEVEVFLSGDEHHDVEETSETFDVEENTQYQKRFKLQLPDDLEQDDYKLRIMISDRYGAVYYQNYNLKIDTQRHHVIIKDVDFNPGEEIKAGRSFTSVVRLKNIGEKDEDNVKVSMEIEELGIIASDYIDDLEAEDTKSSEELYARLPECAEEKEYEVVFTVKYDDNYKKEVVKKTLKVTEGDFCESRASATPKTTIIVGSNSQNTPKGESTVYDFTLINGEDIEKRYTVDIIGEEGWAKTSIAPSNVLTVGAGESRTIALSLEPENDAELEQKVITARFSAGDKVLKDIALTANVQKEEVSGWDSVKKGLQVGLIILVVLLVVLGAVLLINKMREGGDEEIVAEDDFSDAADMDEVPAANAKSEVESYY